MWKAFYIVIFVKGISYIECLTLPVELIYTVMSLPIIIVLQPLKDWVLYLVVAILVGVDVIVLSIVTVWRMTLQSRLLQRTVCTTTNLNCLSLFLK